MTRSLAVRYLGALLFVAVGVLAGFWLQPVVDVTVLLLMAVAIAAWFSGLGPALLASGAGTLALDFFFTPPLYTFSAGLEHIPRMLVFTGMAGLFATASARRRTAERSLEQARDELDAKVRERTVDLTAANRRLSTQYAVTTVLAEAEGLEAALPAVLRIIGTTMQWEWGALWKLDREAHVLRCASTWSASQIPDGGFTIDRSVTFGPGQGLPGRVWQRGQPCWIADVTRNDGFLRGASVDASGVRGAAAFPVLVSNETVGVIELFTRAVRQPDREELDTLSALGSQIGQFTERRRAEQELQRLAGRLIEAQEDERRRIGRELHDHVSQMVGVLAIGIDQLRTDDETPSPVAATLEKLRQDAAEIAREIHGLSHRLHSSTLDHFGLVAALQRLVSDFSARHQPIAIDFAHDSMPASLPSDVGLCLFRVTEESLTNIAKHSHAQSAGVRIQGGPDGIHLSVEDDGDGFDVETVERRGGLGFVSMRERLRALHGTVHVDSAPSAGTRIHVWIPHDAGSPA